MTSPTARTRAAATVVATSWSVQLALITPALGVLLVDRYGADIRDLGWILMSYNLSGALWAVVLPSVADRYGNYRAVLILCAALACSAVVGLATVFTLTGAVVVLVLLGGPAGVGLTVVFAQWYHSGEAAHRIIGLRAFIAVAWVLCPPLAAFVMSRHGSGAFLVVLGCAAGANMIATGALGTSWRRGARSPDRAVGEPRPRPISRSTVVRVWLGFTALHASGAAALAVTGLFVVETLGASVAWAGVVVGLSALLEIPVFLWLVRATERLPVRAVLTIGCLAGVAYFASVAVAPDVAVLIALQPVNALFSASVAALGLMLIHDAVGRPGLASGLSTTTRRTGAILSGVIVLAGSASSAGYRSVFVVCAAVAVVGSVAVARRTTATVGATTRRTHSSPQCRSRRGQASGA